jgi:hypothetical protein
LKTQDSDGKDECQVEIFADHKRRFRKNKDLRLGEAWANVAIIPFNSGARFKIRDRQTGTLFADVKFNTDIKRIASKKVTTGRASYQHSFRVTDDPPAKGKGVFVRHAFGAQAAERMAEAGIKWAALQVAFQSSSRKDLIRDLATIKKEAKALREKGIEVWLWGFPVPSKAEKFAALMIPAMRDVKPGGVILNMELSEARARKSDPVVPAWNTRREKMAEVKADLLIKFLRKSFSTTPLALSSHGFASKALPWMALDKLDGGMPQAYDADRSNKKRKGRTFVQQCLDAYRKHYDWVIPTLGANTTNSSNMKLLYKDLGGEIAACNWWSWEALVKNGSTSKSVLTKRGRVVKGISDI